VGGKCYFALSERPFVSSQYEVHRMLGEGSFGKCSLATHRPTGRQCVVKQIRASEVGTQYLDTFVKGPLWQFFLDMSNDDPHPNVCKYLDFFWGGDQLYAVMEPVLGPELLDRVLDGPPPTEAFVQHAMHQALSALHHIHGLGIVHRDVKLENFRSRGADPLSDLVLIDFGLSCPLDQSNKSICGSPEYIAPDMFRGSDYDAKVDVWSAGVCLYAMLTSEFPIRMTVVLDQQASRYPEEVEHAQQAFALQTAPRNAVELLKQLLTVEASARPNAAQALQSSWFAAKPPQAGLWLRQRESLKSSGSLKEVATKARKQAEGMCAAWICGLQELRS